MTSLLAIDPGSNISGVALFEAGKLVRTESLRSVRATPLSRRLEIASLSCGYLPYASHAACEEPFLRGKNNNGMQRLLGMIELLCSGKVFFIHPMTLKKFMGSGASGKLEMALAAGDMLKTDAERDILADAIGREAFDETDAVCVGLAYLHKKQEGFKDEA